MDTVNIPACAIILIGGEPAINDQARAAYIALQEYAKTGKLPPTEGLLYNLGTESGRQALAAMLTNSNYFSEQYGKYGIQNLYFLVFDNNSGKFASKYEGTIPVSAFLELYGFEPQMAVEFLDPKTVAAALYPAEPQYPLYPSSKPAT